MRKSATPLEKMSIFHAFVVHSSQIQPKLMANRAPYAVQFHISPAKASFTLRKSAAYFLLTAVSLLLFLGRPYERNLTRAREWGPELRALRAEYVPPPCQLSSYKSWNHQILWEVGWLMISIMCNFRDSRSIYSRSKNSNFINFRKF